MASAFFTIPIKTENEQNRTMGRHWSVKAKKRDKVRSAACLVTKTHFEIRHPLIVVKLTRVSAGELDDDGLRSALKSVRDGIASALRIDDGSKLIRFDYAQEKCARGEYAVKVQIEAVT